MTELPSKTNINTWITLAGFALTILINAMSYQAFKTETEVARKNFETEITKIASRVTAVESMQNNFAVNAATSNAQLTAVRESLSELKSAQAETNRLLRDVIQDGARP